MARHLDNGRLGESIARQFLINRGLYYITGNYHCRYGELDLVMNDAGTLAIIEVRYRRKTNFMSPVTSISQQKQQRIMRTTRHFLSQHSDYENTPVRFDVVGITGSLDNSDINWIPAAFTMDDLGG